MPCIYWWLFPPGKSGGLIEARPTRTLSIRLRRTFPPGKSGGLIEAATTSGRCAVRFMPFPPGKSGGLIEADEREMQREAQVGRVSAG